MDDLERAAEQFFTRVMPVYAMIVCIACGLFLAALLLGAGAGFLIRVFT